MNLLDYKEEETKQLYDKFFDRPYYLTFKEWFCSMKEEILYEVIILAYLMNELDYQPTGDYNEDLLGLIMVLKDKGVEIPLYKNIVELSSLEIPDGQEFHQLNTKEIEKDMKKIKNYFSNLIIEKEPLD